jgi:hypothetical protein
MRVLITGGRNYTDSATICHYLNALHNAVDITTLIHGGASGADYLAYQWAVDNSVDVKCYEADWKTHGKAAGPIRNKYMLEDGKPDMVIAFPGGKGTANMVKLAKEANVTTFMVPENGDA